MNCAPSLNLPSRAGRFDEAGRLQNGDIPQIERQIREEEEKVEAEEKNSDSAEPMIAEKVGPTEIAEVVESWTGIPVGKLPSNRK